MKQRLALFENDNGTFCYRDDQEKYLIGYVRVTDYLEVDFPDLPTETVVLSKISSVEKKIKAAKEVLDSFYAEKQDLLALTHEVAA